MSLEIGATLHEFDTFDLIVPTHPMATFAIIVHNVAGKGAIATVVRQNYTEEYTYAELDAIHGKTAPFQMAHDRLEKWKTE